MRVAVGVTLYNPAPEEITQVVSYSDMFDIVYIRDNSPSNKQYVEQFSKLKNVVYIHDGSNIGLPKAYNDILKHCKEDKIDVLATFDQDSIVTKEAHERVLSYIQSINLDDVGVVALDPVFNVSEKGDFIATNVKWVICSGSYIILKNIFKKEIWYDDNYFIDRFDADFSKQIRDKGLQIIKLCGFEIKHSCGDSRGEHSVLRNYYIFRNRCYYNKKYYSLIIAKVRTFLQDLRHIVGIIVSGKEKRKKLGVIKFAKIDFKAGRMGEINQKTLELINKL